MTSQERYTLEEARLKLAKEFNGRVWQLLEKTGRTPAEDEELVLAATASSYLWLQVGTIVHAQRAQWLLAHIHAVLSDSDLAMKHAVRCMELTLANSSQMEDFDLAYAHEALARSHALQGNLAEARKFHTEALQLGHAISDPEDQQIFLSDLQGGDWHDLY
jgi:hypothetical protein